MLFFSPKKTFVQPYAAALFPMRGIIEANLSSAFAMRYNHLNFIMITFFDAIYCYLSGQCFL